jgi:pimeloyl-ACP methyl ester carboxylesterase
VIRNPFERTTREGNVLRGEVRIPEGPPPRSAVVVVHGFKGFKDWGFFPYLTDALVASGHAVVGFNFTGSGVAGEREEVSDLDAFASNTLSRELEELAFVIEMARAGDLLPRRPRALGLVGHSRGGGDAVLHAASHDDVDALATWASVATFDRWTEDTLREWRERGRVYVLNTRTGQQLPLDVTLLDDFEANRERFDVTRAARGVRAPWLIVHGAQDLTVDPEEARTLAREAPAGRLLMVEGAGHTFETRHPMQGAPPRQLEEAVEGTLRHFTRHLRTGEG